MKKLSTLLVALCAAGCATPGDVEKVSGHLDVIEERQQAMDKLLNSAIKDLGEVERQVSSLNTLYTDLRKRVENLAPTGTRTTPDVTGVLNGVDPAVREKLAVYLKALPDFKPAEALDGAGNFKPADLLPHLMIYVRDAQNKAHDNAVLVLKSAKPADGAPVLEPYLSDGSVRGDLLKIFEAWEPCDALRQALLKHANEGLESWRVMVANALAHARALDGVKSMIEFLYSEEPTIRMTAIEGLKWATGFDLGYKMWAGKEDRWAVADKWKAWLKENEGKFEFPKH